RLQRDVTERRRRHTRIADELHQDGVLFLGEWLGYVRAGGVQRLHRDVLIRDPRLMADFFAITRAPGDGVDVGFLPQGVTILIQVGATDAIQAVVLEVAQRA